MPRVFKIKYHCPNCGFKLNAEAPLANEVEDTGYLDNTIICKKCSRTHVTKVYISGQINIIRTREMTKRNYA